MSLDVSPTFLSGDYFAPLAKPKKLLSRRNTKENWGFNAKNYGGIGVLSFSETENKVSKGLLVSRGHHHVGSGIQKFHPVPQPYQVTSLSKSACRPSDQLLPNVNHVDIVSITKEANLLTDKSEVEKSSFKPLFEVFPHFDRTDRKENTDDLSDKRKSLGSKTIEALQQITQEIYKTTSNQRDFPRRPKERRSAKTVTFGRTELSTPKSIMDLTYHDVSTQSSERNPRCVVCACQINLNDFSERLTDVPICNFCKRTAIFRVNVNKESSRSESVQAKTSLVPLNLHDSHRLSKEEKQAIQRNHQPNNIILVTSSKRPSEVTQSYASPLNYLGYYSGRQRNRLSALIRKVPTVETTAADDGTDTNDVSTTTSAQARIKRMDLKRITIPISLKNKEYLKEKGMYCSDMFLLKEDKDQKATLKDVLPMIYFPLNGETKETVTTTDIKEADGEKQSQSPPAMIKRLKSLSHKRYHEKYLDDIPDLRESRIDAKKHFFSGYHASVLRC